MTDVATLVIRVDSTGVPQASSRLDSLGGQSRRTANSVGLMGSAAKAAVSAITALGAVLSVREVIDYSDRWTNVANSLNQVTDSTKDLARVTQDLRTVARDSRTGFEATTSLYVKMTKATQDLGFSSDTLLSVTSTINKAFALSGTTAAEAAGSLHQLGQALETGALNSDEFNSVAEGAPEIMRAIVKHTKIARSELKEFASTGGITSKVIIDSLTAASQSIGEKFSKSTATFAQSMQIADDNLLEFIGSSKLAAQFTSTLGDAMVSITDALPEIEAFVSSFILQFELLEKDIDITLDLISNTFGSSATEWGEDASHVINFISDAFTHLPINVRSAIQLITVEFAALLQEAELVGESLRKALNPLSDIDIKISEKSKSEVSGFLDKVISAATQLNPFSDERLDFDEFTDGLTAIGNAAVETGRSIAEEADKVAASLEKISGEHEAGLEKIEALRLSSIILIDAENKAGKVAFKERIKESKSILTTKEKERDELRKRLKEIGSLGTAYVKTASDADKFAKSFQKIQDKALPIEAIIRKLTEDILSVQRAVSEGFDIDVGDKIILSLNDIAVKAIDTAGEVEDSFLDSFDGIGGKLGDAILSDDWGAVGNSIGSAIGAGIGGPLGAVIGSIAGSVLGDLFSDDGDTGPRFDPSGFQATQGTGSVFGDSDAKSNSILKALEITADASVDLVSINTNMLDALSGLGSGLGGAVNDVVKEFERLIPSTKEFEKTVAAFAKAQNLAVSDVITPVDFGLVFSGLITDLAEGLSGSFFETTQFEQKFTDFIGPIPEKLAGSLSSAFSGVIDAVTAGAVAIGTNVDDIKDNISKFEVSDLVVSLKDADSSEEFNAIFSKIFDDLTEATTPLATSLAQIGEGAGETLTRLVTQMDLVREGAQILGVSLSAVSLNNLVKASDEIVNLVGGISAFNSAILGFEKNFLSAEDQLTNQGRRLNAALSEIGESLPDTRSAFVELAKVQSAVPENIALLLKLQDAADGYYDSLETATEEAADKLEADSKRISDTLRNVLEDALRLAVSASDASLSGLTASVNARKSELQTGFDDAVTSETTAFKAFLKDTKAGLKSQIDIIKLVSDTQIDAIKAESEARVRSNKFALDAAKDGLRDIAREVNGITSALDKLRGIVKSQETRRVEAVRFLQSSLLSGDLTGAGAAAGAAANVDPTKFSSSVDFARAVSTTAGLLGQLESAGLSQKTTAEQTVDLLDAQIVAIKDQSKLEIEQSKSSAEDAIKAAEDRNERLVAFTTENSELFLAELELEHIAELERLDKIVEDAEHQLNALRGIDDGVKGVEAAVSSLRFALFAEVIARANSAPELVGPPEELVGPPTPPGFANGGDHLGGVRMVGEKGPELEFTGPSRVTSSTEMKQLLSQDELINSVNELRREVAQLRGVNSATERNTRKSAKVLERWDGDGIPEERT